MASDQLQLRDTTPSTCGRLQIDAQEKTRDLTRGPLGLPLLGPPGTCLTEQPEVVSVEVGP